MRAGRSDVRHARGGESVHLYHSPSCAEPAILIAVIGVLALFVDFWPNLRLPALTGGEGGARKIETKLGLDLQGGLKVEYRVDPNGDKSRRSRTSRSSSRSSSGA